MAQFTYITEDWIIKEIKKLALDNDVFSRDILDISFMILLVILQDDSNKYDRVKKGFYDYILLLNNNKIDNSEIFKDFKLHD